MPLMSKKVQFLLKKLKLRKHYKKDSGFKNVNNKKRKDVNNKNFAFDK